MMKYALLLLMACSTPAALPPIVIAPVPSNGAPQLTYNGITGLAAISSCAKIDWKNRGVAPIGYFKGIALTYAKAVCQEKRTDVQLVSKAKTQAPSDALAWFDQEFAAKKMDNSKDGLDTLRHSFVLLIGLGLRESSGSHCCGIDRSAKPLNNHGPDTEAGAWQTSYNSHVYSPELDKLFAQYKATNDGCFYKEFHEGVKCTDSNLQNFGDGDSLLFQKMSKGCPAFAAEYAAVMLRVKRSHYGPLNNRAAEIRPECDELLKKVEAMVKDQPELCEVLK